MMWASNGCVYTVFFLLAASLQKQQQAEAALLEYLPKLETLRATAPLETMRRAGLVDVLQQNNVQLTPDDNQFEPQKEIAICHLAHLFEGTMLTPDNERFIIDVFGSWEGTVAIALAAEHLNTGDGSIVKAVEGINQKCNIRFTMESFDVENVSKNDAVEEMIALTDRTPVEERLPCAVIGPYISRNALATALILGIRKYPQLSPGAGSPELDLKAQYPFFGRTISSTKTSAELVILYLYNKLGVRHLGVLHHPDEFGSGYALGLQIAAAEYAPDMIVKPVEMILRLDPEDPRVSEDVAQTIGFLKDTQFTFFFSLAYHDHHDMIMTEAYNQGIAGTGKHNWYFSEGVGSLIIDRTYPKNSPLHLAHVGASKFLPVGGIPGLSPGFDKLEALLKEFKTHDQDMAFLKKVLPKYTTGHNDSIFDSVLESDKFLQTARHPTAFAYDAAIAFGLAACNATQPETYFEGAPLYASLVQNSFQGATGQVVFDPATGSRIAQSMEFELENHQLDDSRETDEEIGFKLVRAEIYQDKDWKELEPLLFNDGTNNIPLDLPEVTVDENLLTPGLRAGGLILCGIVLLLSLSFSFWTQYNRHSRAVKSAQPIFLHIICAGAFILGSSIIPLSIDLGVASLEGCNIACMSFPWLIVIGFSVIFTALGAKTERVNRIIKNGTKFKRIMVTAVDVYRPMLAVLGANVIILSIWTALSPIELDTYVEAVDIFDRPIETYSMCDWSNSVPYYATLGAINFLLLCYAIYVAWRARELTTELSESYYIFKAMSFILLVCFIGVPVTIIARENPSAFFFVCSGIIFVAGTSILLLIFSPKVIANYRADPARQASESMRVSSVPKAFRKSQASNDPLARFGGGSHQMSNPVSSGFGLSEVGSETFSAPMSSSEDTAKQAAAKIQSSNDPLARFGGGSHQMSNPVSSGFGLSEVSEPFSTSMSSTEDTAKQAAASSVMIPSKPKSQGELEAEIERLTAETQRLATENQRLKTGLGVDRSVDGGDDGC